MIHDGRRSVLERTAGTESPEGGRHLFFTVTTVVASGRHAVVAQHQQQILWLQRGGSASDKRVHLAELGTHARMLRSESVAAVVDAQAVGDQHIPITSAHLDGQV